VGLVWQRLKKERVLAGGAVRLTERTITDRAKTNYATEFVLGTFIEWRGGVTNRVEY